MANALAGRLYEASGGEDYYTIGTAADIQYSATGGSDDWARGVAGIKWVYLIELPGKGTGFLLPPRYSGAVEQVGTLVHMPHVQKRKCSCRQLVDKCPYAR